MYSPLLAAAAAALLIAFAPVAQTTVVAAMDFSDVFAPLTCAMAHSGSCAISAVRQGAVPAHVTTVKVLLAAADLN
jgi:hypothetical protein